MSTSPSLTFNATLPVNPSQTIDVGRAAVHVPRLEVADERQRRRLQQPVRLARQLVALGLFLADRQQRDPGCSMSNATRAYTVPITANCSRCCGRHSTLAPTSSSTAGRSRVGIVAASAGRSTPASMPNAPCAAITVAPVWPALNSAAASPARHQLGGHLDRGRRLAPERRRRRLGHLDHCVGVDDADARRVGTGVARQLGLEPRGRTDQRHAEIEMPRRRERAVDDVRRRLVAAHRVNGDPDHVAGVACNPAGC